MLGALDLTGGSLTHVTVAPSDGDCGMHEILQLCEHGHPRTVWGAAWRAVVCGGPFPSDLVCPRLIASQDISACGSVQMSASPRS